VLKPLIDTVAPLAFDSSGDVYYDLISCVADQQIHYRLRTRQAFDRLLTLFSGGYPHPTQLRQLPEEEGLGIKISARKCKTIRSLATQWLDAAWADTDWWSLPDAEIRQRLGTLPGIGPWTIDMILLFTLQRPDVLPVGDFQLKKRAAELYNLPDAKTLPARLNTIAQKWSPYSSLAVATSGPTPGNPNRSPRLPKIHEKIRYCRFTAVQWPYSRLAFRPYDYIGWSHCRSDSGR